MEISIIKIMDKDHKRIKELLGLFEIDSNNLQKALESFNRFKWNLEKHFFIEEKVIFNVTLEDEDQDLSTILNEHSEILNLMSIIEEELMDNKKPDISEMKKLLLSHARFENYIFYPKLDETLNEEQKQEIIDRIKDIIIN